MFSSRGKSLPRFLTPGEVRSMIILSSSNPRDSMIIKSLFYLGLRNSELRNLHIEDIDLSNRMIKVVQGKGKKDRYIPIPNCSFASDLKSFIGSKSSGFLFSFGKSYHLLSGRHVQRIVKKYAIKSGLRKPEEVHPHTLRHSYATHLQNQGIPLNAIQEVLGHADISTTTVYLHLGMDRVRSLIDNAF